jgi:hypothetical protein
MHGVTGALSEAPPSKYRATPRFNYFILIQLILYFYEWLRSPRMIVLEGESVTDRYI